MSRSNRARSESPALFSLSKLLAKFELLIDTALNGLGKIVLMKNNVEDELEYIATYEKPFKAYNKTLEWGEHK